MQYGFYGVQVQSAKSTNLYASKQVICRREHTKVIIELVYIILKSKVSFQYRKLTKNNEVATRMEHFSVPLTVDQLATAVHKYFRSERIKSVSLCVSHVVVARLTSSAQVKKIS